MKKKLIDFVRKEEKKEARKEFISCHYFSRWTLVTTRPHGIYWSHRKQKKLRTQRRLNNRVLLFTCNKWVDAVGFNQKYYSFVCFSLGHFRLGICRDEFVLTNVFRSSFRTPAAHVCYSDSLSNTCAYVIQLPLKIALKRPKEQFWKISRNSSYNCALSLKSMT